MLIVIINSVFSPLLIIVFLSFQEALVLITFHQETFCNWILRKYIYTYMYSLSPYLSFKTPTDNVTITLLAAYKLPSLQVTCTSGLSNPRWFVPHLMFSTSLFRRICSGISLVGSGILFWKHENEMKLSSGSYCHSSLQKKTSTSCYEPNLHRVAFWCVYRRLES